jgi:hypothetical protein
MAGDRPENRHGQLSWQLSGEHAKKVHNQPVPSRDAVLAMA